MDGLGDGAGNSPPRVWLLSGVLAGFVAVVAFAALHALTIVPVWNSVFSPGSIIRGLAGGLAGGWFGLEYHRTRTPSLRSGMNVGLVLWVLLLPATTFGLIASLTDIRSPLGGWKTLIEVVLTALVAFAVSRRVGSKRSTAGATIVAAVAFVLITGGPFPVTASTPAIGLLAGMLPICLVAGATMAMLVRRFTSVAE